MTEKQQKAQAIESTITYIDRQFGKGSLMRLGDKALEKVSVIPTGSLALDVAIGVGGIPRGRVTEIFGPEASGKTTLGLHIIAEAQKTGGYAAFIDAEHAMDPGYAQDLETVPVSLRSAWDISRACRPTWLSPISPSSSAFGTSAATESITTTSMGRRYG